jgi:hypothetical protein
MRWEAFMVTIIFLFGAVLVVGFLIYALMMRGGRKGPTASAPVNRPTQGNPVNRTRAVGSDD